MPEAKDFYSNSEQNFLKREEELKKQSLKWSQTRLALFFIGLILAITCFWDLSKPQYLWLAPAFACFIGLNTSISRHRKVRRDLAHAQTMIEINREAQARLTRDWPHLKERETSSSDTLAVDLNLHGQASLLQLICRSGTHFGKEKLWQWMSQGIPENQIPNRQEAVREISKDPQWFQELECLGRLSEGKASSILSLQSWTQRDIQLQPAHMTALSFALPLLFWGILFATLVFQLPYTLLILVLILNTGISKWMNRGLEDEKLYAGEASISPLGDLFGFLDKKEFQSKELSEFKSKTNLNDAQKAMKELAKWMHFQDVRRSELMHSIMETLFLWDLHIDRGMAKWHVQYGKQFPKWLEVLTQIDALISLSGIHHDHPEWCFASIDSKRKNLEALNMGHPMLSEDQVVRNDFQMSQDKPLMLVSGSNMAGKSTLLRALGQNQVLAQMGAPVSASTYESPYFIMGTSFRVNDSLADGVSYFMAELQQLKSVVQMAEATSSNSNKQALFLFDEILLGTNIHDRQIAVREVTENLLKLGAWGAISTHDLSLSEVDSIVSKMVGVHFAETFKDEGDKVIMEFDYKLKPGLAKTSNALYLVKMVGLSG